MFVLYFTGSRNTVCRLTPGTRGQDDVETKFVFLLNRREKIYRKDGIYLPSILSRPRVTNTYMVVVKYNDDRLVQVVAFARYGVTYRYHAGRITCTTSVFFFSGDIQIGRPCKRDDGGDPVRSTRSRNNNNNDDDNGPIRAHLPPQSLLVHCTHARRPTRVPSGSCCPSPYIGPKYTPTNRPLIIQSYFYYPEWQMVVYYYYCYSVIVVRGALCAHCTAHYIVIVTCSACGPFVKIIYFICLFFFYRANTSRRRNNRYVFEAGPPWGNGNTGFTVRGSRSVSVAVYNEACAVHVSTVENIPRTDFASVDCPDDPAVKVYFYRAQTA